MTPAGFVSELAGLHLSDVFNPYSQNCPIHDCPDAPRMRADVLQRILEIACDVDVDSIWIGRDLGYRGGRRTGLALTDDIHLMRHIARWHVSGARPTQGQAVAERTAAVVWSVLDKTDAVIFLWNVFPLHPHEPGEPFSNRNHNKAERDLGEQLLTQLNALLRPKRLVAIGNDAAGVVEKLRYGWQQVERVRHPSYGGQTQFLGQMAKLFSLSKDQSRLL